MPHSLVRNYLHISFSTKHRYPFIDDEIKEELFKYIGGVCRNIECYPVIVGGYKDHVHILCVLSRKMALMDMMEEVKKRSSKWIKTKGEKYKKFYWQGGYAAFSVRADNYEGVKRYIENQENHHRRKSFKDEYRAFLSKNEIDCGEKYLWD